MTFFTLAMRLALTAVVAALAGCADKGPANGGPEEYLSPPAGLAFSVPDGQLTVFHPVDGRLLAGLELAGWSTNVAAINGQRTRLYVTDDARSRLGVFSLPDLRVVDSKPLAGVPVDLQISADGSNAYVITRNANLWVFSGSQGAVDTMETGVAPRRMRLRPPMRSELWIACAGDCTVYIVNVNHLQSADTLRFGRRPTAIEFSPDGSKAYVALAGEQGAIQSVDAYTYEAGELRNAGAGPFDLAVNYDGRFLVAVDSISARARIWNTATGEEWNFPTGGSPTRVRYSRSAEAFFVCVRSTSRIVKIGLGTGSPTLVSIMPVEAHLAELAFLETVP